MNSGDFSGYFKGRLYVSDKVGIGVDNPDKQLHIRGTVSDLIYSLKIENQDNTIDASSVGVLFSAGGGTNRGKGALVYKVTDTWNRGSFQFLQDKYGNSNNPDLNDAVVTIDYNGKVGIGKTSPAVKLHIAGGTGASLSDGSGYIVVGEESGTNIVMDNNEIIARNNGSGSNLYIQGSNSEGNTIINADSGQVCILNNSPYTTHGLTLRNRDYHLDRTGWAIASGWSTYSTKKSKAHSAVLDNGLTTILKLNPIRFIANGIEDIGFDPEELYRLVPNAATAPPRTGIYQDVWAVNTNKIIPLLVNAVQQQQHIIDQQNKVVVDQNKKIDSLQKRLERLEKLIEKQ